MTFKSKLKIAISLILLATIGTTHAQVKKLDNIVAVVDDDIVLQSELDARIESIKSRLSDDPSQLPPDDVLSRQVLDRLIVEQLQLQMGRRAGVQISDEELNQAFAQLASGQKMSPSQLMNELNQQNQHVSVILRDLSRELMIQKVQQGQVNRRIYVSEAEIDNFLNSAEGQFWQQPSLQLRHIQIPVAANAAPGELETASQLAQQVYDKLQNGEKFKNLVVQYSSGSTALKGGEIGWRRPVEFPPEIAESLIDLKEGEYTAPVRSSGGIHLFAVDAVRGVSEVNMMSQTFTRHILIQPNQIRSSEEARKLVSEIRQRILDGEDFAVLSKEYSEDISNSLKGGELGWVMAGQMVPEFEAVMNTTAVGELSAPVETQYGWHILRVDERRDVDMSSEIIRQQASNVLRSQRYQEELDLWLREIRSDAFVEIIEK